MELLPWLTTVGAVNVPPSLISPATFVRPFEAVVPGSVTALAVTPFTVVVRLLPVTVLLTVVVETAVSFQIVPL